MTFTWSQLSGPSVTLSSTTTLATSFTAPAKTNSAQAIVLQFAANDGFTTATDTVTYTIPANVAPTANAGANQSPPGGSPVVLNGSGADADSDPITYAWTQISGPTVTLSGASTASASFTAPPKSTAPVVLVLRLTVDDGLASTTSDVTITIPANVTPSANAGPDGAVNGGGSVALDGSGSADPDGDPLTYLWTQTGGPSVTLSSTTIANPTFVAPAKTNAAQPITFELQVDDGLSGPVSDSVTITVAANVDPNANAGADLGVAGAAAVTLDGSGSTDPDGDPVTYAWTQTAGPTVTLSGANTTTPTFIAPPVAAAAQILAFDITVDDGFGSPSSDSVLVTVAANTAPVANAGANARAGQGATVTLDASGSSDADAQTLTYAWTQTSGPAVTLTGANTASPSFVVPAVTTPTPLVFQLVVNDGIANSAPQTVTITAVPNAPPVVNAGADVATTEGATVTLQGSATDPETDPMTFAWTQTAGASVTLSNPATLSPSFVAPAKTNAAQTLTFQFAANDGFTTATDAVDVIVAANVGPTANAGPDATLTPNAPATLDGAASSDGDGDALTFAWTQTGGPSVALSNPSAATPSFTAPGLAAAAQTLVFALEVSDGLAAATDTVSFIVPANTAPVANAGANASAGQGATVTLDASGSSDADAQTLTYAWTQTSGPAVTLTGANTASPSFVVPAVTAPTPLVFQLVVNDGIANSAPQTVTLTAVPNAPPVANAGTDQTASGGAAVTLNGSATDLENDPLTFAWTQTNGPSVALTGANTATPNFLAPPKTASAQTLTFELAVNDGFSTAMDSVDVVIAANVGPSADAGTAQNVAGGQLVTLNGAASTDGDNDTLTYAWTQTGGPSVTLSDPTIANPTFTAPPGAAAAQTLTFALTVSDGVATASASVTVAVAANAPPVANAGPDQGPINSGQTVTLDGSGSADPNGDPLTFTWTQTAGPGVTLTNAGTATPSFVAPLVNALTDFEFEVVVSDGVVSSTPDRVRVSVQAVGTVTLVQNVRGADRTFSFSSTAPGLSGSLTTQNGVGQLAAASLTAGAYAVTASDLSAEGYALTAIACNDADSIVNLGARSVQIALSPGENLVCTFTSADTRSAAQAAIRDFLTARNTAILSLQPDVQRRLDRLEGAAGATGSATMNGFAVPGSARLPFRVASNDTGAAFSTSLSMVRASAARNGLPLDGQDERQTPQRLDIWGEAYVSRLSYGEHEGDFALYYLGGDVLVRDDLLLGALVQYDQFDATGLREGAAEGDGWMAGPYLTARLGPHLFADLRAAWGRSDNRVTPLGVITDSFDTDRQLYSASLIGAFDLGQKTRISPELSLRYLREEQHAYTDGYDVVIPSQVVELGELSFSPRIDHEIELSNTWTMRPFGAVEGVYAFGAPSGAVIGDGFRVRAEGGVEFLSPIGLRFGLSGFLDSAEDSFENNGFRISVSLGR